MAQWHDRDLLRSHLPEDGSVRVEDQTRDWSTLIICGPKSRDGLADLTDGNLSLPWMSHQACTVAGHRALLVRVCFAGELGWEVHAPMAAIPDIWQAVTKTGATPFGMYALNAMRLEKGYAAWKAELSSDYSIVELGLQRFVKLSKAADFPGKAAVDAIRTPGRRLVSIIVHGGAADAPSASPVWKDGRIVGEVTSAGWDHRIGRAVVLAMIGAGAAGPETEVEIDIYGERVKGVVQAGTCLWDPTNERIRA